MSDLTPRNFYSNVRRTIVKLFLPFIDIGLAEKGICKIQNERYTAYNIRSQEKRIAAYVPKLWMSRRGIPLIEVWYLTSEEETTPEVERFVAHVRSSPSTRVFSLQSTNEEIAFLTQQLEKNSRRLAKRDSKRLGNVSMIRSFLSLLYSNEKPRHEVGGPAASKYAFQRELGKEGSGYIPKEDAISPKTKCFSCRKKTHLKICARCKREWFCSKECQTIGWKQHKTYCTPIAEQDRCENK